jgi:hypothetical protein
MSINDVFTTIYKDKVWQGGNTENPLSGGGSNPLHCKVYVDYVKFFINKFKIKSVLDLGHGDWEMWKTYRFKNVDYLGVDVARGLSRKLQRLYGSKMLNFKFITKEYELPKANLLISKEVFQHLSNENVIKYLEMFNQYDYLILSNGIYKNDLFTYFKYLLQIRSRWQKLLKFSNPFYKITFFQNNSTILDGQFRGINLETDPFKKIIEKRFVLIEQFDYQVDITPYILNRTYVYKSI